MGFLKSICTVNPHITQDIWGNENLVSSGALVSCRAGSAGGLAPAVVRILRGGAPNGRPTVEGPNNFIDEMDYPIGTTLS